MSLPRFSLAFLAAAPLLFLASNARSEVPMLAGAATDARLFRPGGPLAPMPENETNENSAQPLATRGREERTYVTALANPALAAVGKLSARVEVAPLAAHAVFVEGSKLDLSLPGFQGISAHGYAVEAGYHLFPFGRGLDGMYLGPRYLHASGVANDVVDVSVDGLGGDIGYQLVLGPIALNAGIGAAWAHATLTPTAGTAAQLAALPPEIRAQIPTRITRDTAVPLATLGLGLAF